MKITGLDTSFNCLVGDVLRVTPIVTGVEGMKNLKYTWFLYQRGIAYSAEDTLCHTKDLEYWVNCDVHNYNLLFEVRDTVRDLFVKKTLDLTVSTTYSTGWFVLEDDGMNTDLDMVENGKTTENLMTTFGSDRMEGKAKKIVFKDRHPQEVEGPDGTVTKEYKKAFTVISEKDMRVYDAQNMSVLKYRNDCFYEMPTSMKPLDVATESSSDEVNIDGKFYLMSTGNIGKFGYPVMGVDGTENYSIFKDGILYSQHCYLWDEISQSFVYAYSGNSKFNFLNEAKDGEVNNGAVSNTGCEMKRFQFRNYEYKYGVTPSTWTAYALWVNQEGKYEILDLTFVSTNYPIKSKYNLIKPLVGTITSRFGHRDPTTATVPKNHTGIDIAANTGTVIYAALDGVVKIASSEGDYGNHLRIEKDDVAIYYAHCNKLYVKEGDYVTQNQPIAEVGATGNVTGPHLHFEIRKEDRYVDPDMILNF